MFTQCIDETRKPSIPTTEIFDGGMDDCIILGRICTECMSNNGPTFLLSICFRPFESTTKVGDQESSSKFDKGLDRRMQRIQAPTLIIWGESDGVASPRYADDFAAGIPGSRVERIAAAGHVPQAEQPEETLAVVQPFLR